MLCSVSAIVGCAPNWVSRAIDARALAIGAMPTGREKRRSAILRGWRGRKRRSVRPVEKRSREKLRKRAKAGRRLVWGVPCLPMRLELKWDSRDEEETSLARKYFKAMKLVFGSPQAVSARVVDKFEPSLGVLFFNVLGVS